MFKKIMVPIDLTHVDTLQRAMSVASDIAKLYGATIHYVAVTGSGPGAAARTPEEFNAKLQALANEQATASGVAVTAQTVVSNDVTIELDASLRQACTEMGADLVVVGSHVPGFADYIFSSHGGSMATHASVSVFVVR